MKIHYFVGTSLEDLDALIRATEASVLMIDGTVPGWSPRGSLDLHFDHHRKGGGLVQIDEMPPIKSHGSLLEIEGGGDWIIATTGLDADACVAAAWAQLRLSDCKADDSLNKLRAIALDCDYLTIPKSQSHLFYLSEFAAKAVAAMKMYNNTGTMSERFEAGVNWILDSVKGVRKFPGEGGEANGYIAALHKDIEAIELLQMFKVIEGVAVLDCRSCNRYVDPRCLSWLALAQPPGVIEIPITIQVKKDAPLKLCEGISATCPQYTIGLLPMDGAKAVDLTEFFPVLAAIESGVKHDAGIPVADTTWGGRATVGGSGFNDASVMSIEKLAKLLKSIYEGIE